MNEKKQYLMEVGRVCRENRIEKGVTQRYLARSLGVTEALICHFEKGRANSIQLLMAYIDKGIVNVLDIPRYTRYL